MDKKATADHIIKKHVLFAMGTSLIPVPVIDIVAVTGVQLDMVKQLGILYDQDYRGSIGKSTITALAGNTLSRIGASALKSIPLVGTLLGGVTMSVLAGASTLAVGEVMVQHFEAGGTFLDFDADDWRAYYEAQYEHAKERAETWKAEQDASRQGETIEVEIEDRDQGQGSGTAENTDNPSNPVS